MSREKELGRHGRSSRHALRTRGSVAPPRPNTGAASLRRGEQLVPLLVRQLEDGVLVIEPNRELAMVVAYLDSVAVEFHIHAGVLLVPWAVADRVARAALQDNPDLLLTQEAQLAGS